MITGLPLAVGAAVLGSALLHATWNALAKAIPHRLLASALMGVSFAVIGAVWATFAPFPRAASWPFLVASAVLQTGYLLLLTAAYARGEFRRVYPVARGTAPVLVTAFSVVVLGERLGAGQLAGIALVVAALALLVTLPPPARSARGQVHTRTTGTAAPAPSETRRTPGRTRWAPPGLGLAVATGVVIATYSLVDGIGVRHSGSAAGYAAWSLAVHGPLLIVTCLVLAGPRGLVDALRAHGSDATPRRARPGAMIAAGLIGGALSLAAYSIVLWAQSRASLSMVSALRETSVLFAGVIGAVVFAEGFSLRQTVAAAAVVGGIVLMQAA